MNYESRWSTKDISVGDYVSVQVSNKQGDRNLDGARIYGIVKDVVPEHRMVRLESGWCCHEKDVLLVHRPRQKEEKQC